MTVAESPARTSEADLMPSQPIIAFRWRILALVADLFVLEVVESIANVVFGVTHVTSGSLLPLATGDVSTYTTTTDIGVVWVAVIVLVYFTVLELLFGATVGKWMAGLRVTGLLGERAHPVAVLVRNLLRLVDWLPFLYLVGGIAALSSQQRQRLGDRLGRTLVVTRESLGWAPRSRGQMRWRLWLAGLAVVALVACSAVFFYYGRPPLVVQGAVNTGTLAGQDGVRSYTLGAPKYAGNSLTYPIRYQTSTHPRACSGTVTLRWAGLPEGWQLAETAVTCQ